MSVTQLFPAATPLPASITSPPTVQFTPPPECNDPNNNWIVTTSCYLEVTNQIAYPDWLTCTLDVFGAPSWYDSSCIVPIPSTSPYGPKTTIDGVVNYYTGCPSGYSTVHASAYPGYYTYTLADVHFDATAWDVRCCPTQYNFGGRPAADGSDPRQNTITVHDGIAYDLFIYPLPGCAATSISQLSGKEIPVQRWSNDMAWDKRQVETLAWDYKHGTMFANEQAFSYTVFQGTHTCYEDCDTWFTYCKQELV
ncbi:hypothetical protein NPX13_g9006 [Xylaria arbuscula]|uniref:Uncharacterized protein n=1 Tax=Xylaria arbuscula TaxID=114810 RepID=A0A9W8N7J9_9PEZI|nr:hypothetical protein NPX13_g9006 [Xylaria arbuscula]